ncbi:MAG TPA: hypothetical protein VGE52_15425, partial [Pirellulales bacterium]
MRVPLNELQQELWDRIGAGLTQAACREFVYETEYLGYLPFGQYQWIKAKDVNVIDAEPWGWKLSDIAALEQAGLVSIVARWDDPY